MDKYKEKLRKLVLRHLGSCSRMLDQREIIGSFNEKLFTLLKVAPKDWAVRSSFGGGGSSRRGGDSSRRGSGN